jgi:hypothetical protein
MKNGQVKATLAALLVAGTVLAGCGTPVAGPEATPTEPTAGPASANTRAPAPAYTLSGIVFFDHNGNGSRDEGEPPIEGVLVEVGGLSTTSGPDGRYSLVGVSGGKQRVQVESPTREPAAPFRYISLSLEAFQTIDEPIKVTVGADTELNVALMQGILTLPLTCETLLCEVTARAEPHSGAGVSHSRACRGSSSGIDYAVPEGQPVIAAAPGFIVEAENGWPEVPRDPDLGLWDDGNRITIDHGYGLYSIYTHLSDTYFVETVPITRCCMEYEWVSRGQVLALSGETGTSTQGPHLHFETYEGGIGAEHMTDPYRDPENPLSRSLWTKDNDPQCLP